MAFYMMGREDSLLSSIGIVCFAFVNKALPLNLRKTRTNSFAFQCLIFVVFCTWLILLIIYRCQMNAVLAVAILPSPINSLADALDLNYGVTFFKGGVIEEIFSLSPPGSAEQRAYEKFMTDDTPPLRSYDEGVQKVLDGTHVFLQKLETMKSHSAYPCEMVEVKNYKVNQDIVFPFKIGHPLLPIFNEKILKLKEAGILNKLWKKYIYNQDKQCEDESGEALGFEKT